MVLTAGLSERPAECAEDSANSSISQCILSQMSSESSMTSGKFGSNFGNGEVEFYARIAISRQRLKPLPERKRPLKRTEKL
jgi:hypothetical protein